MKKPNVNMDYKEEAKMWMKKPKLDEIELKHEIFLFYIHNMDECRNILLHYNILCSQLSFTANMNKRTLLQGRQLCGEQRCLVSKNPVMALGA
jgi:hypothetical protein